MFGEKDSDVTSKLIPSSSTKINYYISRMHKVTSRSSILGMDKSRNNENNVNKLSSSESAVNMAPSMDVEDWRRAISTPTKYRVGSASFHMRPRDILLLAVAILMVIVIIFLFYHSSHANNDKVSTSFETSYNPQYPLTSPLFFAGGRKFRIGIISDLDHGSKVEGSTGLWKSYFLKGHLIAYDNGSYAFDWDSQPVTLHASLAQGGRGMELSELVVFNGKLITVDDRTGVIYKVIGEEVIPWIILADGNGEVSKGFKSEWATVKDGSLYVGGLGKEWTNEKGEVLNLNPQFVKRISPSGAVAHLDWHKHYNAFKAAAGIKPPGYMIHEAAVWSSVHQKWFFLPRRASKERYDDKLDEHRAANILVTASADFSIIETRKFGPASLTHGFSSFKFVPGTHDDVIIALKSEEANGKTASYIRIFSLSKGPLTEELKVGGDYKYEGVEFI